MKIERVRLERRSIELEPPFLAAWDPEPRRSFEATLVLVETDEGLTGVGSGDTMDGFERYEHLFVGTDPGAIERHVAVIETLNFHAGRYWPLDDVSRAADILIETLEDEPERARMAQAAHERFRQALDADVIVPRLTAFLTERFHDAATAAQ